MNISIKTSGDFKKTEAYFKKCQKALQKGVFDKYGRIGVAALAAATPVDSGKTASSWDYRVTVTSKNVKLEFINTNINKYVNIAVILQYGHATRNGGWVRGYDYINPAIKPVFEALVKEVWEEVISI